jgi:hypothetical protein
MTGCYLTGLTDEGSKLQQSHVRRWDDLDCNNKNNRKITVACLESIGYLQVPVVPCYQK